MVKSGGTEPIWYFALAEVVYQARYHNFNVPVLALHQVAGNARSILGMTDHVVRFPVEGDDTKADEVEIDLWGIVDGRIIVGEARPTTWKGRPPSVRRRQTGSAVPPTC